MSFTSEVLLTATFIFISSCIIDLIENIENNSPRSPFGNNPPSPRTLDLKKLYIFKVECQGFGFEIKIDERKIA